MARIKTGGRQKGVTNKTTRVVRDALTEAFEALQNDSTANLISWGKANPTQFYQLAAKLIPTQLSNDSDNPLTIQPILGMKIY